MSTLIKHLTDDGRKMEATERFVAAALVSAGVLAVIAFVYFNFIF